MISKKSWLLPITIPCSLILIKIASLFKVSFIVGSSIALFSGTSIVIPVLGCLGSAASGILFFGGYLVRILWGDVSSFHYLAYHIPGFCAALYWAGTNRGPLRGFLAFLVPLLCMMLFMMHPVGNQAFLYSFFWFIPMALYCCSAKSIFAHGLISTFIAHAVGSTIWIYTIPMTVSSWHALLPVVIVERLLFATGMVICYYTAGYGYKLWIKRAQKYISLRCNRRPSDIG